MPDYFLIKKKAEEYRSDMCAFLRRLIYIPSVLTNEGECIDAVREEMEKVGFDYTETDGMGNLIGTIGNGKHIIAMDGHADTVGFGNMKDWDFDPLSGYEDETRIGGRGSSDMKGGIASMVYAGKLIKELGLLPEDCTLKVVISVQEEDCEGRNWQYIIKEFGLRPEFVILTEPTHDKIFDAQKGRMELGITTTGISAHGSMPHMGVNAIYKMAPVISAIERLNGAFTDDGILGKGTVVVSQVNTASASRCAVCDKCTIVLDRRMNTAENRESVLEELRSLPEVQAAGAKVFVYENDEPTYTGLRYNAEYYFPSWHIDHDEVSFRALLECYEGVYGKKPVVESIPASTNGCAIMGMHGIPCMIFGPGMLETAHKANEYTEKDMLVRACAVLAGVPEVYSRLLKEDK